MSTDLEDYSLARVIKGIYDSEYKTIATDSDGNIVGVFKGDYAGTLTTLAVDSKGRIKAVLTDPEDVFGNPHYMGAAELAVRLGCISTFDRRGNVVMMDDFEASTFKWASTTQGTGASVGLSTNYARNGEASCKLVTGDTTDDYAQLYKYIPTPVLSKIGLEAHISVVTSIRDVIAALRLYTGAKYYRAQLRWDEANENLDIYTHYATWTTIDSSFTPREVGRLFHQTKLVADFNTGYYTRCVFDSTEYDISAYKISYEANAIAANLMPFFQLFTEVDDNRTIYIDDVIITQNEEV